MFERKSYKVSIIIPTWLEKGMDGMYGDNEVAEIAMKCHKRLLEKIDRSTTEIILVDNGSTLKDEDIDPLKRPSFSCGMSLKEYWGSADIVVKSSYNRGFAQGMNLGIAVAHGEFMLFLNNDIFVFDNFIENLLEVFEHKEFEIPVGSVMPNLIKSQYQTNCLRENGKLDIIKAMELKEEEIVYPNKDKYEMGAEFGSAIMMNKDLIEKIKAKNGGYQLYREEFIGLMSEDRYLHHQIRKFGYQTYRTNKIRCVHVGNLSATKVPNRKQYTESNRELLKKMIGENNITN